MIWCQTLKDAPGLGRGAADKMQLAAPPRVGRGCAVARRNVVSNTLERARVRPARLAAARTPHAVAGGCTGGVPSGDAAQELQQQQHTRQAAAEQRQTSPFDQQQCQNQQQQPASRSSAVAASSAAAAVALPGLGAGGGGLFGGGGGGGGGGGWGPWGWGAAGGGGAAAGTVALFELAAADDAGDSGKKKKKKKGKKGKEQEQRGGADAEEDDGMDITESEPEPLGDAAGARGAAELLITSDTEAAENAAGAEPGQRTGTQRCVEVVIEGWPEVGALPRVGELRDLLAVQEGFFFDAADLAEDRRKLEL